MIELLRRFCRPLAWGLLLCCGLSWSQLRAQNEATQSDDVNPVTVSGAVEDSDQVSLAFLFNGEVPSSKEQLRLMEIRSQEIADQVIKATVNIQVGAAQGSGVVVSRDGYVLTAAHVIGRPGLTATLTFADGRQVKAKTLGVNRSVDSGMLKIEDPGEYDYLDVGESSGLKVGQWVIAIGHPGGIDESRGLVLRVGRLLVSTAGMMKTDCVLVGGDSGGPLVDFEGRVVGIHSRISSNLWDNIHVPIDTFSNDWDELVDGKFVGAPPRPYIGITMLESTNKIQKVDPDSPAEKAGLLEGDVVVRANNREIENKSDLERAFARLRVKQVITIVVDRDGQELEFEVEVGAN
ncbi:MAG TPA: trypsin-like peptidase domain-containing protein [Pirellulaceae bacterium]|nr:trypsin-like peptidase domain-containing protein [Pirellulaceae bacterium]